MYEEKTAVKLEVFLQACEHFRHDISAQWTQAGLIAVIQAALLSLFASSIGPQDVQQSRGLVDARTQAIAITVVGFVFSLTLAADGDRSRKVYSTLESHS
ncbi:hypothetical protein ACPW96_23075 [Micromonospora sp. DT81.3]|uniref:hypothetical protein n=1 Tax=Micromonospora sp. DT81.3 TaxID=3416523 RepID=UPI003CF3FC0A